MKSNKITVPEAVELIASLNEIKDYTKLTAIASKSMLTIDEVSLFTGLKVAYLYKLTSSKEIPHYKPNGKVLYFKRSEVEEWMMQNRQNTTEETEQKALKRLAEMKK